MMNDAKFKQLLGEMGIDIESEDEDVIEEIRSLYYAGYYKEEEGQREEGGFSSEEENSRGEVI